MDKSQQLQTTSQYHADSTIQVESRTETAMTGVEEEKKLNTVLKSTLTPKSTIFQAPKISSLSTFLTEGPYKSAPFPSSSSLHSGVKIESLINTTPPTSLPSTRPYIKTKSQSDSTSLTSLSGETELSSSTPPPSVTSLHSWIDGDLQRIDREIYEHAVFSLFTQGGSGRSSRFELVKFKVVLHNPKGEGKKKEVDIFFIPKITYNLSDLQNRGYGNFITLLGNLERNLNVLTPTMVGNAGFC